MKKTSIFLSILICCMAEAFPQQSITGTWQYETIYGVSQIVFNKDNTMNVDGVTAGYSIQGEYIVVHDTYGDISYRYQFRNGRLILTFPDGSQIELQKAGQGDHVSQDINAGENKSGAEDQYKLPAQAAASQATAQKSGSPGAGVAHLYGKLCFYSGSSSSYSSYSRTEYIYFDGKGRFQFWKESSFSSDAGIAYGSDQNPSYNGSYSVNGDIVNVVFDDGERVSLKVNMRQDNGRITELMHGEKLYATGLCE